MKKILITGTNGYIGTSFKQWMMQFKDEYQIDTISVRRNKWIDYDFSVYDVVIHLAAIVHKKNISAENYYAINRDLAIAVAKKAKQEQVKQFIFFSTMAVYGVEEGVISSHTALNPISDYGKSKLEAERLINELTTSRFKILVVRPPMIYGPRAKGNYSKLSKLAKAIPFFPDVNNQRSMLYIENLHAFLKLGIDCCLSGNFHPQNEQLVNTSQLVLEIRQANKHRLFLVPGCNSVIKILSTNMKVIKKIFGNLFYDESLIGYPGSTYEKIHLDYQEKNFRQSIEESEK